jgi:alpha-tubulin suppressor-like RCC1 family protein
VWGFNFFNGLWGSSLTPVQRGTGYSAITSGGDQYYGHALALKPDGTLWAWGANYFGQLGDGTYVSKGTPVQIGKK